MKDYSKRLTLKEVDTLLDNMADQNIGPDYSFFNNFCPTYLFSNMDKIKLGNIKPRRFWIIRPIDTSDCYGDLTITLTDSMAKYNREVRMGKPNNDDLEEFYFESSMNKY